MLAPDAVTLERATPDMSPLLENLLELHIHDLSEIFAVELRPSDAGIRTAATPDRDTPISAVHGLGPHLAGSLDGGIQMKNMGFAALIAVGLSTHLIGQQPVAVSADKDDKVTLVGCVIKGEGGYVLSNADRWASSLPGAASATVASASSVAGRTFYWLKDDDDLEKHAGRKVEVAGKLDNEIDQARIKVEREDGMIEIEFQADGESKVTIKAPESFTAVGTTGTVPNREKTHRVTIRKIDVKSVKVLASTCQ